MKVTLITDNGKPLGSWSIPDKRVSKKIPPHAIANWAIRDGEYQEPKEEESNSERT